LPPRVSLLKTSRLRIVVDSASFESALTDKNAHATRLLTYFDSGPFDFLRSPLDTHHVALAQIPKYKLTRNENGFPVSIEIEHVTEDLSESKTISLGCAPSLVTNFAEHISGKSPPSQEAFDRVILAYSQAALTRYHDTDLLVTGDDVLLSHRWWFQGLDEMTIASVEEALEIMDLFAKRRGIYFLSSHHRADGRLWYWCSFRSKIPHYNVGTDILASFDARFAYVLMGIDEMGTQYYLGADNDTMQNTMYHFNYFLSLVCGIFDALAIETRDRLKIQFKGDNIPARISLNKKAGDKFLRALSKDSSGRKLRQHIDRFRDFIDVIYGMREFVVHRELPQETRFRYLGKDGQEWTGNFIDLSKNTKVWRLVRGLDTTRKPYEPMTKLGLYRGFEEPPPAADRRPFSFLSPYDFAKAATMKLIQFSDAYLESLGYPDFLQTLSPTSDLLDDIKILRNDALGF